MRFIFLTIALAACKDGGDAPLDSELPVDDSGPAAERDADGDGAPATEDCDDQNRVVFPGNTETAYNGLDDDCDPSTPDDDLDGDGFPRAEDCDDADAETFPGATERCDSLDNDCDGVIDNASGDTWYEDRDGDGAGDPARATQDCAGGGGLVADASDCDDLNAAVFPGAEELCDSLDNDCDGEVDEGVTTAWYADSDGDGHGDADYSTQACSPPSGYVANAEDCDDSDPQVSPDGVELCDGEDDDCDGSVDEDAADAPTWYTDGDGDGAGDPTRSAESCEAPSGMVADATDCDDADSTASPGATELCDGVDNDCDGSVDEDAADAATWTLDFDGDGHGGGRFTQVACTQPSGYVSSADDCDDSSAEVSPSGTESCDGLDNDCDGTVDDDDEVLGDAADCAAVDCADLLARRPSATDGTWSIDPDGAGALEVWCEMDTDGGGWTLVASFSNSDGSYNWTQYASTTSNLGNWRTTTTFGSLSTWDSADYKSEAFSRLEGTALLAQDNTGGWASYDGALSGSLYDTVTSVSSCQTSFLSGVTVDSSDSTLKTYGKISYYGADPNNSSRCAFSNSVDATDSSVVALAHQGCGTAGFGHIGWYTGSAHEDRDFKFCLGYPVAVNSAASGSCSTYFGSTAVSWFYDSYCSSAGLYVR